MDSPAGPLTIVSDEDGLRAVQFGRRPPGGAVCDPAANAAVVSQLDEYFQGSRRRFDLPLAPRGTPFQRAVWSRLVEIPWGETRTYRDVARSLGKPGAARAVGLANHHNPIAIIIPCHRVIGASGSLTGYAAGLDIKARLLALEGVFLPGPEERTATSPTIRGRVTAQVPAR